MTNDLGTHIEDSKLRNYDSERGAHAYRADYQNKLHRKLSDRLERRIFDKLLRQLGPCASVLDLPCGAGRLHGLLKDHAPRVIEADFSSTMLALNREHHQELDDRYLRCSALEIPLAERSVELVVSVRLSHHINTHEGRRRHLEELFRVAQRGVICTWFSETSLKNLWRRARSVFIKKRRKNTMHNRDVSAIAAACGFRTTRAVPLAVVGSGHMFGLFERQPD
ncbi:MAG: class I SAM-dependent methyltransferase [Planctomycetota bacterium]|jgi:ubiquinone/menaquinone biosynthesis C-methylase UbiE